ncbi:MAG: DUF2442 domain-containing protein [Bacteroidia bacterium]|nr:DUF2442 domain-containing protein [Bacteroidia bacterium]
MISNHIIKDVNFQEDIMSLNIDGKLIKVLLDKISSRLKAANDMQRNFYKISPSGYGIHWPLIDEDLAVDALLKESSK